MIIDNRNESHKAKICTIRVFDRPRVSASRYAGKRAGRSRVFRVKRQRDKRKKKEKRKDEKKKQMKKIRGLMVRLDTKLPVEVLNNCRLIERSTFLSVITGG